VKRDLIELLREHGIQPSAQRVAVAEYALATEDHPSADEVWDRVRKTFPMLSRATVYNTLNLFVEKGLLQALVISEGKVVFDPKTERHHHFIDDESGRIHDIPWDSLQVKNVQGLRGFQVRQYQVLLHGKKQGSARSE
jgi:Fur family transcriptional regulator, iron response regulator